MIPADEKPPCPRHGVRFMKRAQGANSRNSNPRWQCSHPSHNNGNSEPYIVRKPNDKFVSKANVKVAGLVSLERG
jgi:hypothetical protein